MLLRDRSHPLVRVLGVRWGATRSGEFMVSASEKLKALDPPDPEGMNYSDAKGHLLFHVIPQIVAVVEAAAEAKSAFGYMAQTQRLHPELNLEKYGRVNEKLLHDTLTALEEALFDPHIPGTGQPGC